jgi:hypothetical protein
MRRHFGFIAWVLLFGLTVWGQQIRQLTVSPALPGASGTMGISHDTSGTIYINIQAKHLARPDQLHPARSAYVAWVQLPGEPPQNHGVLQVNDKLEATYFTTVHTNNFDVFVTAENNSKVTRPTGEHLLSAHN